LSIFPGLHYQVVPTDLVKTLTGSVEIVKMGKKAKEVTFVTRVRMQVPLLPLVPDQISQSSSISS